MFTTQHYIKCATIFRKHRDLATKVEPADTHALVMTAIIARDFADMFAEDNSRFSRGDFLEACGIYS